MTNAPRFDAPEIHRTEIDGVPVFWTPADGPRLASLMFRVGRADEPAPKSGITHLVEHLALAPLGHADVDHNGFVTATRTAFHATGTDEELRDFVHAVVASLRELPLGRVAMERRILTQEAASRGSSAINGLRWFRYGNVAHGLIGAAEIGLDWLGPEPVQAWARERFTSGNAALWWSGPPPADLRLELPPGNRYPVPTPSSVMGITYPTHTDLGGGGVSIGYVAPRTAATRIAHDILIRRLRQDLRYKRGLIYDVSADYDPQGPKTTHISLAMDCRREDGEAVLTAILDVIDDLLKTGPTPEEIEREATAFAERSSLPGGRLGFLDATTFDELVGRVRESAQDVVAEYLAVTPDAIKAAARAMLDTLLVFAPPGAYDEGRLHPYPAYSLMPVEGRTVRPNGMPIGPRARKDRLIVGPTGVSLVGPQGQAVTVRYKECVGVRHWDGPIRELWGADGFSVTIRAADWWGGTKVIDEIDAALPRDLIACDEHGIGALELSRAGSA